MIHKIKSSKFLFPGWDKAPKWANYWACDENGRAHWYANRPIIHEQCDDGWYCMSGDIELLVEEYKDWKTLYVRDGNIKEKS